MVAKLDLALRFFAIANRDTDRAFLVLKDTVAYAGFYCYYEEPNRLNNPSSACIRQVSKSAARLTKKAYGNCSQLRIKTTTGEIYKFW